jgi:hypothetical protein
LYTSSEPNSDLAKFDRQFLNDIVQSRRTQQILVFHTADKPEVDQNLDRMRDVGKRRRPFSVITRVSLRCKQNCLVKSR